MLIGQLARRHSHRGLQHAFVEASGHPATTGAEGKRRRQKCRRRPHRKEVRTWPRASFPVDPSYTVGFGGLRGSDADDALATRVVPPGFPTPVHRVPRDPRRRRRRPPHDRRRRRLRHVVHTPTSSTSDVWVPAAVAAPTTSAPATPSPAPPTPTVTPSVVPGKWASLDTGDTELVRAMRAWCRARLACRDDHPLTMSSPSSTSRRRVQRSTTSASRWTRVSSSSLIGPSGSGKSHVHAFATGRGHPHIRSGGSPKFHVNKLSGARSASCAR